MYGYALAIALLFLSVTHSAATPDWHTSLYLGNGGIWTKRIQVVVHNGMNRAVAGAPADITIGNGAGEANLVGANAEDVRVCNTSGTELLYAIHAPDGSPVTQGPIPDNSVLTLPVDCAAGADALYFVYFENPDAWMVPDVLESSLTVRNSSMEAGSGAIATGWVNDSGDALHQSLRVAGAANTGTYCLRTTVTAGASPSWISTRQGNTYIIGGATYTLRAWVKAENVQGDAGWYIHVGDQTNPMIVNQIAGAGGGSYGWKQVTLQFTAPTNADRADLGTVLWGTGTAWFDDVTLTCNTPALFSSQAAQPETLQIQANPASWYDPNPNDDIIWGYRMPVAIVNPSSTQAMKSLVRVDLKAVFTQFGGKINLNSVRVVGGSGMASFFLIGNSVLFQAQVSPRTIGTYYVYLSSDPRIQSLAGRDYAGLLASPYNLVLNPSFDTGQTMPDYWTYSSADPTTKGRVQPGLFGTACVVNAVPHGTPLGWPGWHQDIPVEASTTYLYAAWAKCQDITDGSVRIYAHHRNALGELCQTKQFADAGPDISGTCNWTLMSGIVAMPPDCTTFQLHLTMNATGTLWHDGVVLAKTIDTIPSGLEVKPSSPFMFSAWAVNPIKKVFPDDMPASNGALLSVSAARNEKESLRIAVRSSQTLHNLRILVDPPTNPAGRQLLGTKVGAVGYVPIDYPSGYFTDNSPAWYRKYPTGGASSDGWPGFWPDPIIPIPIVNLEANVTQPIWITVPVSKTATPGTYKGRIRFMTGTKLLREMYFTIRVWKFALPDESHLPAIYDVRLGSQWDVPGKTTQQVTQDVWRLMAENRICPDIITPDPAISYRNGIVIADFTAFDAAADYYLNTLHFPHFYTPWYFYCFGWGNPPGVMFDEAPYAGTYPYTGADRSQLRAEFRAAYKACLKAYWDHLKAKGWDKKCVLYLSDEPFYSQPEILTQMKALCTMVHEVDPTIPIYVSTWQYIPEWAGYIDVPGIGHSGQVPPSIMQQILAGSGRLRFTTDGQMCTDTPYLAFERLMPYYCFSYGVEGYEFWGATWLTYNPYEFGWHAYIYQSDTPTNAYWVRYPNGDGYLIYPGGSIGSSLPVSSIRLEQAREGVEDYEYLYLLSSLIKSAKAAGKNTATAEAALVRARNLVSIPNADGRYSTLILKDPNAVISTKQAVGAAIEGLMGQ